MKFLNLLALPLFALLTAFFIGSNGVHADNRAADGPATQPAPITWTGTFVWSNDKKATSHTLTTVVTPAGDNQWNAIYNFKWSGKDQAFNGQIVLDPKTNQMTGTAAMPQTKRTFAFKGTLKDGVVTFADTETTGGKSSVQGTGTLNTDLPAAKN